jgi:N-acetylglutamate synthase-like GNAT family acetyltransferase
MKTVKKKKSTIHIRDAHKGDKEVIAGLLRELGYPNTPLFVMRKLDELNHDAKTKVIVAVAGSEVVGVASVHIVPLFHQEGNLCRITAIVVSQKQRKKGIGTRLIEYVEDYARSHRCIKVEITSGDQRTSAHQFYHQVGYKEVSRRFIKLI